MSHNSAVKEQEQILGQSVDGGRADSGGVEQVMRFDENERPAMQQAQVQRQESQQLEMVPQLDDKHATQPRITHSQAEQAQNEQSEVQQLETQQPQTHQPLQSITTQQQPQQQERPKQHTLSEAEVQSLCAETIKARDRAYCMKTTTSITST